MQRVFIFIVLLFLAKQSWAQLLVNAGPDKIACMNGSLTLGGTPAALSGTPPYTYQWQPSAFLNNSSIANPIANGITSSMQYTLTVTDKDTNIVSDVVVINLDAIYLFSAGLDTGYCFSQEGGVTIGAPVNNNSFWNFNWKPTTDLNNPTAANPLASPTITTIYTLTVSDGICPDNITQVTVTPFAPPNLSAGPDTTINEGQTITLQGSGATIYYWTPDYRIKYYGSANPDVWPIVTTTYVLSALDQHGCFASDQVVVNVIKGDQLFFYSAFTPNADGENDFFYIGNLEKYPDNNLKIYNRYGKQIYSATNYDNTWNGTYLGEMLPTGTYFYVLNDGKDKLHKGTVTILR